ncbi:MAG TPA: DUF927 domain-containing protein [Ruminococcus sp.]|nr:DUF927 domain-containing protein [Ruminococcus sp.]
MALFVRCLEAAKNGGISPDDMNGLEWRFHYSLFDFTETEEPYKEVFYQPTPFLQQRALERISIEAAKCGYRRFKQTYKAFVNGMRKVNQSSLTLLNPSDFPNQPIELECGEWHCDSTGVSKILKDREEYACQHPIMPVERLVNIDTGEEKLRVAFYKGKYWRDFIASKRELFDSSKIIQYSALGVSVTSKSAKLLSEYLCDVETLNPDIIPETESVGRLGYIGDGSQFSPYVDDLIFDGEANYRNIYDAISSKGNYTLWLSEAQKCRTESLTAQILLAASFASPLLNKMGCLPFFVHLWGVESGTGKTVALMLAASVWGDPDVGKYIQTFNSTQVSCERTAAFLNNIPLCIDELQLSKDSHGHSKCDVYQLAQGVGRGRGNRAGGIDKVPTWSLCILTTGESPIVQASAGAGAVNRVVDIECRASESVIKDGFTTSSIVKQNYGFAGKEFIEALSEDAIEQAMIRYRDLFKQLSSGDSTEKQAMAAAMLLIADELADKYIFHSGKVLTVEQISGFLKEKSEVSAGQRAYNFLCDYIAMNQARFTNPDGNTGEIWGKIIDDKVWINASKLSKVLSDEGYSKTATMSWIDSNGLLEYNKSGNDRHKTVKTSVYGIRSHYYIIHLPEENRFDEFIGEEIDFL